MLRFIQDSLRVKFTIVLFCIGVAPLVGVSLFFYYTSKEAFFQNVFKELKWNVNEISELVESHFDDAGKNMLIASKNTAFAMYYRDPANRVHWVREQHRAFRQLRALYPDMLDEACFIGGTGQEIARIVYDEISMEKDLESDEDRNEFFREAYKLAEGEVYQGEPVISEDSRRWVVPNATPIYVDGKKSAILHFEITLTYFQNLLKKSINPDRGYGFIISDRGEFVAHTLLPIHESDPLPHALTHETPDAMRDLYAKMMGGASGIESFQMNGMEHYAIFRPVETGKIKGRNDNKWSIAYVIPSDRIIVEASVLKYNMFVIAAVVAFVAIVVYSGGYHIAKPIKELASATKKMAAGEMMIIPSRRKDEIGQLAASFNIMVEAVQKRDEALRELAVTDGLTGLYNQRHFKAELEKTIKSAARHDRKVSLILADVDFFKHYNDSHGHSAGDMALKAVATVLAKSTREVDLAGRYGGEEFVVILPETEFKDAIVAAERMRRNVAQETIPYEETQPNGDVTVSIGVATYPDHAGDMASLIEAADKAMYEAKKGGRNRVVGAGN